MAPTHGVSASTVSTATTASGKNVGGDQGQAAQTNQRDQQESVHGSLHIQEGFRQGLFRWRPLTPRFPC
jgi:hypothetical protein